jgi:DNA-nicking Smr family endonuclease
MSKNKKDSEFKHNPFGALKGVKIGSNKADKPSTKNKQASTSNKSKTNSADQAKKNSSASSDEFLEAMRGVKPLDKGKKVQLEKKPKKYKKRDHEESMEDLIEEFPDLVFDPEFSDEFQEFKVSGISKKEFSKLKRGDFPPESHLDLHGLTLSEAEIETRKFVDESSKKGKRVILLITGRGKRSEDGIPVLKQAAPKWLLTAPTKHRILAFCSARQKDGGLGALYILLKRKLTPQD